MKKCFYLRFAAFRYNSKGAGAKMGDNWRIEPQFADKLYFASWL